MTHTQSIKFRSFSFYSGRSGLEFKRSFISGRSEENSNSIVRASADAGRFQNWWRAPKTKRNYSEK